MSKRSKSKEIRASPIFERIKEDGKRKQYKTLLTKLEMIEDISNNLRFDTSAYKDSHKDYTHRSILELVDDINKSKKGNEINSVIELYRRLKKKINLHLDEESIVLDGLELTRIKPSFNEEFASIRFLAKGEGGTVSVMTLKDQNKPFFVLKVANSLQASLELIHESLISAVLFSARLTTKNFVFSFFPNFLAHAKLNKDTKKVQLVEGNPASERYCMISQYVQGKPLRNIVSNYKLESNKRQIIFATLIQLANSLVKAQRYCKFMHFDLHTRNVLLSEIDQSFEVKFLFDVPGQTTKKKVSMDTKFVINIIDYGQSVVTALPSHFENTKNFLKVIRSDKSEGIYHQFRDVMFGDNYFYQGYDFLSYLIFLIDDLLASRQHQLVSEIVYSILLWCTACKVSVSSDLFAFLQLSSDKTRWSNEYDDYFFLKNSKANREMCKKLDIEKYFYMLTCDERDEEYDVINMYRNL